MERQHVELFAAAREGRVEVLQRHLQQNPSVLNEIRLTSLSESLLHAATKSGQLSFVVELLKVVDGDVAGEVDKEGFRALDIAVIMGKVAIVKELLRFDPNLGGLMGNDNRSALHYAAAKGRVEIIVELLSTCPDCLESLTVHGETALHLAVKNHQLKAFTELVSWLERLSKQSIINAQDEDGNTVLHLAVSTKQYTCLKLVVEENCSLRGTAELNVGNVKGLTPLDISDIFIQDCYDARIKGALQQAGAIKSEDSHRNDARGTDEGGVGDEPPLDWEDSFLYKKGKESPSETRNALLVVAALLVTITFQVGVNPPSGLFEMTSKATVVNNSTAGAVVPSKHIVGDYIFLASNTLSFSSATFMLAYLTFGFPMQRELFISLFMMLFTYLVAIDRITGNTYPLLSYIIVCICISLPYLIRWVPLAVRERWKSRPPPPHMIP